MLIASSASAQTGSAPPVLLATTIEARAPDENGVDMYSGTKRFSVSDVAIAGLTHTISSLTPPDHLSAPLAFNRLTGLMDNYQAILIGPNCPSSGSCTPTFNFEAAGSSEVFTLNTSNGGFQIGTNGGQLLSDASSSDPNCSTPATYTCRDWVYVEKDGTTISLSNHTTITKIVHPDGLVERVTHATTMRNLGNTTYSGYPTAAIPLQMGYPVLSVNRSDGLQLKYQYGPNWDLLGVVAVNNAYEYCDPTAAVCNTSQVWPASHISWGSSSAGADTVLTVSDSAGRATRYTLDNFGRVRALKPPTSVGDLYTFDYCLRHFEYTATSTNTDPHYCYYYYYYYTSTNYNSSYAYVEDRIITVRRDGQTWQYGMPIQSSAIYADQAATFFPIVAARPDGILTVANQLASKYLIDYDNGRTYATFEQNLANKVSTAHSWDNGGVNYHYSYDGRANVLSDGITSASYDSVCQNNFTCNKPNWTKDANGNQTDYVYDPQHGGVLSVTMPADSAGIRPQTRFGYTQRYAWFLDASGNMVRSSDPIWMRTSQSICQHGAAAIGGGCAIPGDEVVTTYDYGPDSGPNNLWLRGIVVTANGVSRRTCYTYDRFGHQVSATSPRAGLTSCP